MQEFINILENHWGKLVTIVTGAGSIALWLRTGRGKDKLVRRQQQVDADGILHDQIDRLHVKYVAVMQQSMEKDSLIAYLNEHCNECVPKAIHDYQSLKK